MSVPESLQPFIKRNYYGVNQYEWKKGVHIPASAKAEAKKYFRTGALSGLLHRRGGMSDKIKKFQKDREVKGIKRELDEYNTDEEIAVRLEAEAARAERNLKAKKRLDAAKCRIRSARDKRASFAKKSKCSTGNSIGDIIWPKAKTAGKKVKKTAGAIERAIWPPPSKKRSRSKKKDSFLDGLF